MKTIKITDEQLYNSCVISAEIDNVGSGLEDVDLELTDKGMKLMYPENWNERSNHFNITGEFGENDYIFLGFKII